MSDVVIKGNASGTGSVTIESPNTNSDYTVTLPTGSGELVSTGGAQTIEFAAGSASTPSITTTGDTNTGIFFPAADTIAFAEGGAEAMRIDSSGNITIAGDLTVNGTLVGGGDVAGPASATDNAVARFDGTTGKLIQNSGVTIDDSNNVTGIANLSFNSGYGSSAVAYGVRSWVNFNGTGTVAIRASGNVSSITDNGTGDYTVNFTTAMPDADYAFSVGCATSANNIGLFAAEAFGNPSYTSSGRLAGSFRVTTKAAARLDTDLVSVAVFR